MNRNRKKHRYGLLLLLAALIFLQPSLLQAGEDRTDILWHDVRHFMGVSGALLRSPFTSTAAQWQQAGMALSAVLVLTPLDREIRTFSRNNQSPFNDKLFYLDHLYGMPYSLALPAAIYGVGFLSRQTAVRLTGLRAAEAFLWAGGLNYMLKTLIGRRRPDAGDSPYFFKPFQWTDDTYQSFASGHAAVTFAVSTVLAKSVENVYWKVSWYGAAALVAGARVYHNRHWLTDVCMGALLGYGVGYFVSSYGRETAGSASAIRLQPYIAVGRLGLELYF